MTRDPRDYAELPHFGRPVVMDRPPWRIHDARCCLPTVITEGTASDPDCPGWDYDTYDHPIQRPSPIQQPSSVERLLAMMSDPQGTITIRRRARGRHRKA